MRELPRGDDKLVSLVGTSIPSQHFPGAEYRVEAPLGFGSVSVAFYGALLRRNGAVPVVLKVHRPSFVQRFGPIARSTHAREVELLGRLNTDAPPNPFVVRLIDDGTVDVRTRDGDLALPWTVVEYVYGGAQGTTLTQRVETALGATGFAFAPFRAMGLVECLTGALAAIHDLGATHRGVSPTNIFGSGSPDDETYKLSDIGVLPPPELAGPIPGLPLGLPGFVAPELVLGNEDDVGPWTDTFALGCVLFHVLTGERLFPAHTMDAALEAIRSPVRRSIRECAGLVPELRSREQACKSIDFVLSWATGAEPVSRIAEVHGLTAMISPHLRSESLRPPPSIQEPEPTFDGGTRADAWSWRILQAPGDLGVFRSVAWDGAGRCLAATNQGLYFWDGTAWVAVDTKGIPDPTGIRFVRRLGPGRWLLGGDASMLALYATGGVTRIVQAPEQSARFERLSGALDDVAVLVSVSASGAPSLSTFVGKRWLKPQPLPEVAFLGGIAQLTDSHWLLAGRATDGASYAAFFSPLSFTLDRIPSPPAASFTACAAYPRIGLGLAVTSAGHALFCDGQSSRIEPVTGAEGLSACRVDNAGRGWVAGSGGIWLREVTATAYPPDEAWTPLWNDPSWQVPIVSLFAEEGLVMAVAADGGMLIGNSEMDATARASSRRFG